MIECPKCGTGNRDIARFCHNCAAPLVEELICLDCGTGNPSTAKFCLNCAAPLRGQTPRRTFTTRPYGSGSDLSQTYRFTTRLPD